MRPSVRYGVAASLAAALGVSAVVLPARDRGEEPSEQAQRLLEDEARRALRLVADEVMGARLELLETLPVAPLAGSRVSVVTDSVSSEIRLREGEVGMELVRIEDGREQVLASGVQPLWAGEATNGMDDNGNGLIDEPGFHVVREGVSVRIRLSLACMHDAEELTAQVETTVTHRR